MISSRRGLALATILFASGQWGFASDFLQPSLTDLGAPPRAAIAADFNGDGKMDIAAITLSADYVSHLVVLLGRGDGTFQSPISVPVASTVRIAAADVNRDGKVDLILLADGLTVLLGNGDGTFQAAKVSPIGVSMETL